MRKKILKYIEVAENIEKYIIRNHLKVGDKLPGGRYFTELFNTVKILYMKLTVFYIIKILYLLNIKAVLL